MQEFIFEKLEVWQKARKLVVEVYRLLELFPTFERYALCDQIRRAAVSIASNIAEGAGRASNKEKIHFIEIAYGSLMETFNQLIVASDLGYISEGSVNNTRERFTEIAKMLSGWRNNLKAKL